MRKTPGNVFLGGLGGCAFHFFPRLYSIRGGMPPDTFQNFCASCYNIQIKPYATSKMELIVTKNKEWLETVVDCCDRELHLKCDRAPRSDSKIHR